MNFDVKPLSICVSGDRNKTIKCQLIMAGIKVVKKIGQVKYIPVFLLVMI